MTGMVFSEFNTSELLQGYVFPLVTTLSNLFLVGRVNLVDLQQAINVDFSHVEAKVNEIVKSDKHLNLVLGQLIDE